VQVATFRNIDDPNIDSILRSSFVGMDVVLTEGHKRGPYPKIEVVRASRRQRVAVFRGWLLAVVTDLDLPIGARRFQLGDASGVAEIRLPDRTVRDCEDYSLIELCQLALRRLGNPAVARPSADKEDVDSSNQQSDRQLPSRDSTTECKNRGRLGSSPPLVAFAIREDRYPSFVRETAESPTQLRKALRTKMPAHLGLPPKTPGHRTPPQLTHNP
jgi:hypothetical protein